jgi:hypothetical protein
MLAVPQATKRVMFGWWVNNELEAMSKKVVLAIFVVLSEYLPEATGENLEQPQLRTAVHRVGIRTRGLQNRNSSCKMINDATEYFIRP